MKIGEVPPPEAAERDAATDARHGAAGTGPEDIRRGLLHVLKVFLAARIGLTIVALVGVALLPSIAKVNGSVPVPGWPAPPNPASLGWANLVTAWERFDALWFLRIAATGYVSGDGSAVFFPLYPLLTRVVSTLVGGHPLAGGLIVSNLAYAGALAVFYFLTRTELSEEAARRVVIYAAVFPTAFFFLAPYSESLFFLLAITAIWAARRQRWAVAGLAGALAALTRNLGLLLVVPLAVEAFHQYREHRDAGALVQALVWSGAVVLGTAAYLLFWRNLSGDWLAPVKLQQQWQRTGVFPLISLGKGTNQAFRWIGIYPGGYHLLDWLVTVPALGAAVYAVIRFRPVFWIYVWVSLLAPLSFIFEPRPFMSLPRFLLPLFPVYWAMAKWSEDRPNVHTAIVAASAAGLGIMTLLFVNWFFIF